MTMQALLVASGQNLKRWLRTTGWGRRGFPGAALDAIGPLGPPGRLSWRRTGMRVTHPIMLARATDESRAMDFFTAPGPFLRYIANTTSRHTPISA